MTSAKMIRVQHLNKVGLASQTTERKPKPFQEIGKMI
jgi:hypothetical protein